MKREPVPCTCIALYGAPADMDLSGCLEVALSLFAQCGAYPDWMGLTGKAFEKKAVKYEHAQKKLLATGFESVEGIDIFATREGWKQLAFGWRVTASLIRGEGDVIFAFDQTVHEHDLQLLDDIALRFHRCFRFRCGISYERELAKGPVFYGCGMISGLGSGPDDRREKDKITKWLHENTSGCSSHLTGRLRDIFPQNWLTSVHQGVHIGGLNLIDWIEASPQRGTLHLLSEGLWSWRVDAFQADEVRRVLSEAGVLICA